MAQCSGKSCTLIEKLLDSKALNCQSCKKLLRIPVFLVNDVGNVCDNCMLENKWNGIQNDIFNVFLEELIIPCANVNVGCNEEISNEHFEEHSKICKFRPVKCPHQGCKWRERQDNLSNHFFEDHKENVIDRDTFQFELNLKEPLIHMTKLLIKRNLKFLFVLKQDSELDELTCTAFKFHKDAPSSMTVTLRDNARIKESDSFKIDFKLNQLDLIDQEYSVKKMKLTTIQSMLLEDNNNMVLSLGVDLPPADVILETLECPICIESMAPPIFLCAKGHSICNNCVKELKECPTCTAVVCKEIRNYHLESLTSQMFYSCAYKTSGCTAVVSGDKIMEHEANCLHHLYQCPLECIFQYNSKTILNHLSTEHKKVTNKYEFDCKFNGYQHQLYILSSPGTKSIIYINNTFFRFTYSYKTHQYFQRERNPVTNFDLVSMNYAMLELKRLNLDLDNKHIDNLYCKITMSNLKTDASVTQIHYLKNSCYDNDCYSIYVPIETLGDTVDVKHEDPLHFKCELLMK